MKIQNPKQFIGKSIADFIPEDLKKAAAEKTQKAKAEAEAGGETAPIEVKSDTHVLTGFDVHSQGEDSYRSQVLNVVGNENDALFLQDTTGDGKIDNATMSMTELRGGKNFTTTESYMDRNGDGTADVKVDGKYIAAPGAESSEALSQQFYEDASGNGQFDDAHKTHDTTQKIDDGKAVPISAARFYDLIAGK